MNEHAFDNRRGADGVNSQRRRYRRPKGQKLKRRGRNSFRILTGSATNDLPLRHRIVYSLIRQNRGRRTIEQLTGINAATQSKVVADLIKRGLVTKTKNRLRALEVPAYWTERRDGGYATLKMVACSMPLEKRALYSLLVSLAKEFRTAIRRPVYLAKCVGVSRSTASRFVSEFERNGMLTVKGADWELTFEKQRKERLLEAKDDWLIETADSFRLSDFERSLVNRLIASIPIKDLKDMAAKASVKTSPKDYLIALLENRKRR